MILRDAFFNITIHAKHHGIHIDTASCGYFAVYGQITTKRPVSACRTRLKLCPFFRYRDRSINSGVVHIVVDIFLFKKSASINDNTPVNGRLKKLR